MKYGMRMHFENDNNGSTSREQQELSESNLVGAITAANQTRVP